MNKNWYYSHNDRKRRVINYYGRIGSYIYYRPIAFIGKLIGMIFSLMPIQLSATVKENIKINIKMPMSYDIRVVVDRSRDIKRAKFCYKEKSTVLWIEKYYQKGDVIFDVGANIGAVSLISAAHLEKDCLIYAFEPLPTTFGMLFKNIMTNNYDEVIIPLNIALSDNVAINQFNLTSIESGSSGHSIDNMEISRNFNKKSLTVLTQTLDSVISTYHINLANHIKIDVDGVDYEVLLGGEKRILNSPTLKTILIEKNGKQDKIRSLVKKYGFVEVELTGNKGKYENIGFIRNGVS